MCVAEVIMAKDAVLAAIRTVRRKALAEANPDSVLLGALKVAIDIRSAHGKLDGGEVAPAETAMEEGEAA